MYRVYMTIIPYTHITHTPTYTELHILIQLLLAELVAHERDREI